MRVILDTNVFISYLLAPQQHDEKVPYVMQMAFFGRYTLLVPADLLAELQAKMATKPYLVKHIPPHTVEKFLTALAMVAELIPPITEPIPVVSRDKKDDYLFAYAVVGEADYLVSGDEDVLVIKQVQGVKIVSPAEFYDILNKPNWDND